MNPERPRSNRSSQHEGLAMRASWAKDPEINFVVRSLLAHDDVTPQQIVSIVLRVKKDPTAFSVDMLKQHVHRAGSRSAAITILQKTQSDTRTENADVLSEYLNELVRLTPQKAMSPWMQNERARALSAMLLSNQALPIGRVVAAIRRHCNIPGLRKSSFHKPLRRWKNTAPNRTENPRTSFAEALCRDCSRYDPQQYNALIPLARRITEEILGELQMAPVLKSEEKRRGLRMSQTKRLAMRLEHILSQVRTGKLALPPLTDSSIQRLSYPPYKAFIHELVSTGSVQSTHISSNISMQAYRTKNRHLFASPEVTVRALTIDFNFEGGTPESRMVAQKIAKYFADDLEEQKQCRATRCTSIWQVMFAGPPGTNPILRCSWRNTGALWTTVRTNFNLSPQEKDGRTYQVPLAVLERRLKY